MERGSESDLWGNEEHPATLGHEEHTGLKLDNTTMANCICLFLMLSVALPQQRGRFHPGLCLPSSFHLISLVL